MTEHSAADNLTWRVHLAKEQPARAVIAAGISLLVVVMVGLLTLNLFWPLFSLAFLVGSLHDFFFPMTYAMTERGVSARGFASHRVLEWDRARRYFVLPDGVKVSPLNGPSRLEDYRGVFLRCSGETRDRVVAIVQDRLTNPATQPRSHPATFSGEVA